ncbi:MAG: glycoside hydrolase family 27 protein, partial [Bacteroidota bacterium]|nr:glycoside hydrolase family 27 protein [Bacteroidota bacterium]
INKGLIEHGWTFINIDDGWEAPERSSDGTLNPNTKFPNMKELTSYIHSQGLKMGIYSSPGPRTCGGYLASYLNEHKDAKTWADLGIDYIKYDWCSYGDIAKNSSLEELQKPYFVMQDALKKCNRDIVFSLCQYGMGDVWEWGAKVGGNLWRTTGDITDNWSSLSGIGFSQTKNTKFSGPGHWNDPDMLIVGKVGWGPSLHNTHLTTDEQYTHITLWSLLAAPLLIGCDMSQLDDFTLNLLCNDEVIDVNQDPLGQQAAPVKNNDGIQIWMRPLEDHSYAVGVFNVGNKNELTELVNWDSNPLNVKTVKVLFSDLKLKGKFKVRDIWRQKNLEVKGNSIDVKVPHHGVAFLKITPVK